MEQYIFYLDLSNKRYRGKGYFSKLFKYMINDLKEKGYAKAIVGVKPKELINKEIYNHYGFTEYIKTSSELYPDGTKIGNASIAASP